MLRVTILKAGCFNCEWLAQHVTEVLGNMLPPDEYDLTAVSDMLVIADYAVLRLPALVINDTVLCQGRLPSVEQIMRWIAEAREHSTRLR